MQIEKCSIMGVAFILPFILSAGVGQAGLFYSVKLFTDNPEFTESGPLGVGADLMFEREVGLRYGPILVDVTTSATVGASQGQNGGPVNLHLSTAVEVDYPYPTLLPAIASVGGTIEGRMTGSGPYPSHLVIEGHLTGHVEVSPYSALHDGSMTFGSYQINVLEELFFIESGDIDHKFVATVPVDESGNYKIAMSLYSESWSRFDITSGDFGNTMSLTAIKLPSGEVPESAGWTLLFEDGILSPNISVPEPGTLLSALLAICLTNWTRVWRRS